ncbi:MAG: sensor domain-containing diguanylate cyclase [Actinomycetota bacterium]
MRISRTLSPLLDRPDASAGRIALYFAVRYATPIVALLALTALPAGRDVSRLPALLTAQILFTLATHTISTRGGKALQVAIAVGMSADIAILGMLVAMTGGVSSPLMFLFTVQALAAGILLTSRAGIRVLSLSTLAILVVDLSVAPSGRANTGFPDGIAAIAALWILGGAGTLFSTFNERELSRRNAELATIRQVTLDIENTLSLSQIFADLCRGVVSGFGFDSAAVLQREGDELRCVGAVGVTGATDMAIEARGFLARAMSSGEPVVVTGTDANRDATLMPLLGPRGYLAVAIADDGVLIVTRAGRRGRAGVLRAHEIESMGRLSHHARLAIANARMHATVSEMARTDPLTGLANHGEMQARLSHELGRVERFAGMRNAGRYPSLILFDIDHFKRLNDKYGHQAGDAVLRQVSETLRTNVRSFDVVARYGGEEFAVILPETGHERAREVAERIRRAVSAHPLSTDDPSRMVRVTVSAGVASAPANGTVPAGLIKSADAALYHSKESGRNRTTHAMDDPEPIAPVLTINPTRRRRESAELPTRDATRRARARSSRPKRRTPRA